MTVSTTARASKAVTLSDVGAAFLAGAALTSTWNALPSVGGFAVTYLLVVAAVALVGFDAVVAQKGHAVASWIWAPTAAIMVVVTLHTFAAVDSLYLSSRFVYFTAGSATAADPFARGAQWAILLTFVPLALALVSAQRREWIQRVIYAWLFGIAASAAVASADFVGISNVSETLLGTVNLGGRGAGLTFHPNSLGISCAMAVPVALWLMVRRRFLGTVVLCVLLVAVLASGSRAAQAGALVAIIATLTLVRATRTLIRILALTGVIVAVYIARFDPEIVTNAGDLIRFTDNDAADSDSGRAQLAGQAIADARRSPLYGIGLQYLLYAHNIYLQVLAAGGLILFVAMTCYWWRTLRAGWAARGTDNGLPATLTVTVLVWLGAGFVSNQLIDAFLYFPVAAIVAVSSTGRALRARDESASTSPADP